MSKQLSVSVSPHIRAKDSTKSIMLEVILALVPASVYAIFRFGIKALFLILVSCLTALLSELIWEKLTKQAVTIWDFSAVLTGLLLALNLPVNVPIWIPIIGSAFAIIVVKQVFGGIGKNFMNPALAARCFLLVSWTSIMTDFSVDGVSGATPLALAASGADISKLPTYVDSLVGKTNGCIGEVSCVFLAMGAIYLISRKIIDFRIPLAFIGTVFILSYIFGMDGVYQILNGGLFLGACFMATDYVTSPMTKAGKWIFGFGCGLITVIIRKFGGYPEGVSFSILFMNVVTPLIDRAIPLKPYGVSAKLRKEVRKNG